MQPFEQAAGDASYARHRCREIYPCMDSAALLLFPALLLTFAHLLSVALAIPRCRKAHERKPAPERAPLVTIIRPVCGLENNLDATLRSTFQLHYPAYEVIFCIAFPEDPAVPLVRRLIDEHPRIRASLLIGNDVINENPKLNNVAKGWRAAASDWIIMADSNVLMPSDYIQRLLEAWEPDTGAVCSPAVGGYPVGLFAEVECAFLNSYATRWQYAADSVGFGFAQGKSMLLRRDLIALHGGVRALALDLAEDAAVTKIVRSAGLRVRLVDSPFPQPLGKRSARDVWRRQVRWARLRRGSFKFWFALEILTGGFLPLLSLAILASAGVLAPTLVLGLVLAWYGSEALLVHAAGWPLTLRSPLAWLLRDLLLPAVWIGGWIDARFVWRGNTMRVAEARNAT